MRYERALSIGRRHRRLIGLIRSGRLSTPSLARRLGVSEQTVYRDVTFLKEHGYPIRSVKQGRRWAYHLAADHRPLATNTGPSDE